MSVSESKTPTRKFVRTRLQFWLFCTKSLMTASSQLLCLCTYTRQRICSVTARPVLCACSSYSHTYNRHRFSAWGSSVKCLTLTYIAHCSYTILSSTISLCNVSIQYVCCSCACLGVCMCMCMCMCMDVDMCSACEMNRFTSLLNWRLPSQWSGIPW